MKLCPLQWKHGVLSTGPPGQSHHHHFVEHQIQRRELRGCRRDRGSGRGIRNETNMESKGHQGSWKQPWRQEGDKHGEQGSSLGIVGVSGPRDPGRLYNLARITQLAGGRAWIKYRPSDSAEVGSFPPGLTLLPITDEVRLGYPTGMVFLKLITFSRRGTCKPRVLTLLTTLTRLFRF